MKWIQNKLQCVLLMHKKEEEEKDVHKNVYSKWIKQKCSTVDHFGAHTKCKKRNEMKIKFRHWLIIIILCAVPHG